MAFLQSHLDVLEVTVREDEVRKIQAAVKHDCTHKICQDIILRSLFARGITVKHEQEGIDIKGNDLNFFFTKKFEPFLRQAMQEMFWYGIGAGTFITEKDPLFDEEKPIQYPVVVHRNLVELKAYTDRATFKTTWGAFPKTKQRSAADGPDPSIFIFHMPDCSPDITTGSHNSIVAKGLKHSEFIAQLFESMVAATKQRAHPPVMVQKNMDAERLSTNVGLLNYADSAILGMEGSKVGENTYKAIENQMQITELTQAKRPHDSAMNDPYMGDAHGEDRPPKKMYQTPADNVVFVPDNYEIARAQAPMPEVQPDLLLYESNKREDTAALYGVPASFILSGAKNHSKMSNNNIDDNEFLLYTRSLQDKQRNLLELLQMVYLLMKPDLKGKSDLIFELPLIPFISSNSLYQLQNQDIISDDATADYLIAINGLGKDDKAKGKNKHNRPPVGGNENQSGPRMEIINDYHKAQAEKERAQAESLLHPPQEKVSKEEKELMDKQIELEKIKIEGQKELMEIKIKMEEQKFKHTLEMNKSQIAVNKSVKVQPKGAGGGGKKT